MSNSHSRVQGHDLLISRVEICYHQIRLWLVSKALASRILSESFASISLNVYKDIISEGRYQSDDCLLIWSARFLKDLLAILIAAHLYKQNLILFP